MNKDESLDRLLQRAARKHDAATGACLDAETIAAWTEGTLTPHERAAAETHAADCHRCLEVLAAIARTTPSPTPATASWFRLRWLVPLATAAAAIIVVVLVYEPRSPERAVEPPATTVAGDMKPVESVPVPQQAKRADAPANTRGQKAASETASARSRDLGERQAQKKDTFKETVVAAPPPAPAARAATAPPAPAAPVPLERTEALMDRRQLQARVASQPAIVVSPDPNIRWRLSGPSVERSTDGGQSWKPQPTGTNADLLAGSSPSPRVCWIVGRNGVVLLTTDGETWRRVDFPVTVDLIGVSARDALDATVTVADARRYRTTDGGRSWTLQGDPPIPF